MNRVQHNEGAPALELHDVSVTYGGRRRRDPSVTAVDCVNLVIAPTETLGLVGESGSGKSSIGKAVLGLTPVSEGAIRIFGQDVTHVAAARRRDINGLLQVVFQDPFASLNPARTIGRTLGEMLRPYPDMSREAVARAVCDILERVGLGAASANRYPSAFSGGQRQRIAIARALIVQPRIVVCDEPVSALDLSVQAQVLNLMRELQQELGMTYLFISHDLGVVRHVAHRIAVLYHGQVVEAGPADRVYGRPLHPYTRALVDAEPRPDPAEQRKRREARSRRMVETWAATAVSDLGCPFAPRCQYASETCRATRPQPESTADGSVVACHHWREVARPLGNATPPQGQASAETASRT